MYNKISKHGYQTDVLISLLQKSIRRSLEEEALFALQELYNMGYYNFIWRRLLTVSVEDIGLAQPNAVAMINNLFMNAKNIQEIKETEKPLLPLIMAVIYLVRCKKSRLCDNVALNILNHNFKLQQLPKGVVDIHTEEGRKMGKDLKHFLEDEPTLLKPHNKQPKEVEYLDMFKQAKFYNEK